MKVQISPHPWQYLLLSAFLITITILVQWCLTVVLICMFLMANHVEYLYMCLLTICISSLEKCLFKPLTQGNPLVVQWLGLHALTAEGLGSIPGQGTQIPQAARLSQRKRKRLTYLLTIHQVYKEVDFQEAWMTWLMSVVT